MLDSVQRSARWSAIALGASFPISTALDNVLLVLLALTWAASGLAAETAKKTFKNKYLLTTTLLFVALAIGMAWSAAPWRDAFGVLGKYVDLLFIPIIATVLRNDSERRTALTAFAASIALTVVLSWLLWLRLLPAWPVWVTDGISPTVFKYKATHNILVAFGVFVFLWLARTAQDTRWKFALYALALLAAANVVLLVNGATGYLILGAMLMLFALQGLSRMQAALVALGIVLLGVILVSVPGTLRDRTQRIVQEINAWQAGQTATRDHSSSVRLQAYQNTLRLIAEHPLTGVGTGGFAPAYAKRVEGTSQERTVNPHNEFLLITAQLGLGGLLLLLWMGWTQWRASLAMADPMWRGLTRGLLITMLIGCAVNSMLLDHAEGLFYAWFSGVLLGGVQYSPDSETHTLPHA